MQSVLSNFGLTNNEIHIFTTLIEQGTLSATELAKYTGLNRPYVYYAIERLLEKGFLSQIQEQGKKKYANIALKDILLMEEAKVEALKEELILLEKKEKQKENYVEVLKGRFVIKNIIRKYKEYTQPGDEILSIGLQEEIMEQEEPIFVKRAVLHNVNNNISERIITTPQGKKLPYATTSKYRALSEKYLEKTAKIIFPKVVVELFYQNPMHAIIITNEAYAKTAKNQFNILWEKAEEL